MHVSRVRGNTRTGGGLQEKVADSYAREGDEETTQLHRRRDVRFSLSASDTEAQL